MTRNAPSIGQQMIDTIRETLSLADTAERAALAGLAIFCAILISLAVVEFCAAARR
jgi:hypothetical protein